MSKRYWFHLKMFILLASLPATVARAADLGPLLKKRNDHYLKWRELRGYLVDPEIKERLGTWNKHPKNQDYTNACHQQLTPFFQSKTVLSPICHFWRKDNLTERKKARAVIELYIREIQLALEEISKDPRNDLNEKAKANQVFTLFSDQKTIPSVLRCLSFAETHLYTAPQIPKTAPEFPFRRIAQCLDALTPQWDGRSFLRFNLSEAFPFHPGHLISEVGFTGGNRVRYLTQNDVSKTLQKELESKYGLVDRLYPIKSGDAGSVEAMEEKIKNGIEVFTEAEGFYSIRSHPVWSQQEGIFSEILKTIDSATESIYFNVFFLGGTMGSALAKHLVHLVESKPNLRIFLMQDLYNHFGHQAEMRPIFNYLKAYSNLYPDRMLVVPSHIKLHVSALPRYTGMLLTDDVLQKSGLQQHLSLYGRGVSDHSKVIVVDGASRFPKAIVGSKNLTDSSGSICYDEAAIVEGPAAAVVLDDYYFDMSYALDREISEASLRALAKRGWSKNLIQEGMSKADVIASVLRPFDLMGRDAAGDTTGRIVEVAMPGTIRVRTGYNNVDFTRNNIVDQVVHLIFRAKKKILIKDQYLFDPNVINALFQALYRRPSLDVRVILEPLVRANPPGMPNLLYLDLLTRAGAKVKWKKLVEGETIVQEFHGKTISVDGETVITGSANKDQSTMFGSFREEQLEIIDPVSTQIHDDLFEKHWADSSETTPEFVNYDFTVPLGGLIGPKGEPMTPKEFILFTRNLIRIIFYLKGL